MSNQQTPPWMAQRESAKQAPRGSNQNDNTYYRPEPNYNTQYNNNTYQNNQSGRVSFTR